MPAPGGATIVNPFVSSDARRRFLRSAALVAVALLGGTLALRAFAPSLMDPDALRAAFLGFGPLAGVAFVLFAALAVVLAPVPGQVVAFVGGYLFGPVAGTAYSLVGFTLGSGAAFLLSRTYGRPFLERTISGDLVARFDGFVDETGILGVFVVFLVPGLPDDVVCFAAGLTRIRLSRLLAAAFLGRAPGIALVALAGASVETGSVDAALAILAVAAVVTLVGWYYRVRIERLLRDYSASTSR